ncbi:MAG: hypothetical protein P4L53_23020 [Candidatus Obscuribacterales bacterium]|nr:hypothetical protein [Candidatus Obscuribacterales bacterium]
MHTLQMAYSGELAAALAYAGHWRSVREQLQREAIHQIELDEWHHRRILLRMLNDLGERPIVWRDWMMRILGYNIFFGCFVTGWFLPMYFAGRLEDGNILEYKQAAEHARCLGMLALESELLDFSSKEEEHEAYFYQAVQTHWMLPYAVKIFGWGALPKALHEIVKLQNPKDRF